MTDEEKFVEEQAQMYNDELYMRAINEETNLQHSGENYE